MANRFFGDFRSTDTTIDPNGQRYRVVIFTNYTTETIPYEYENIIEPHPYGYEELIGRVPINNYAITMTDEPFIINVEGDKENIYKPYRCSTASVSFLQSNINLEFVNTNGTNAMVLLLKWKNEVAEVNGHMYNSSTGETLYKKRVASDGQFPIVFYNDYEPYKYDRFCYTVEWVGFSTPETFSMEYSHITDVFTLNCQDALSTLQYMKYDRGTDNQICSVQTELFSILETLGAYQKIYVTDTIRFNSLNDIFSEIFTQSRNGYDEDLKPIDKLAVLERIFTYLNVTAIPYKNTLILTTPNAIAENLSNYYVYSLPSTEYAINFTPSQYTQEPNEYLNDTHVITADDHRGNASISTTNIIGEAICEADNFNVGDLMPDIDDKDYFTADGNMAVNYYSENVTEDGSTVTNYYTWERKAVTIPVDGKLTLKHYNTDTFGGVWNPSELDYTPSVTAYDKPGCYLIEHSGVQQTETANTLPLNSNYGRDFYFHTARFIDGEVYVTRRDAMDTKSNWWQPMLIFDSDNVLFFSGDNLNICGDWTFYCAKDHQTYIAPYSFYNKTAQTKMHTGNLLTHYNYVWAKVRVSEKWLSNSGETYAWSDTECFVKLYVDWKDGDLAFSNSFPFKQTNRNIKGSCIPLPISGDAAVFGNVHIELDRPLGTYYYACTSAILKDFSIKVIKVDETKQRNMKYKTDVSNGNTETADLKTDICSTHTDGALWSEAVKGSTDDYHKMSRVYNTATGNYHLPEQHITANHANQYSTPTIALQMQLRNIIKPYTLVTWGQMSGRKFIADSVETDVANETQSVTLVQVKEPALMTTTRRETTRNYRRNRDLITNAEPTARVEVALINTDARRITDFDASNGFVLFDGDRVTGNMAFQTDFSGGNMLLSVPNEIGENVATIDASGNLVITL